jgi:hypothetical protein
VSAAARAPLAVTTTVPAGAGTVAISVFRLSPGLKRAAKRRHVQSTAEIATVYRKVAQAKRYVFRLTERPFRHLEPGRYLIQVRVGPSRTALGPVASRLIQIKAARRHTAR